MLFVSRLLAICGLVLALLPICYGCNFVAALLVVLVLLSLWFARSKVALLVDWISMHQAMSMTVIIVLGIFMRVLIGRIWNYWENAEPVYSPWSDSFVFWEQAKEFAGGSWPETKSWCTTMFYGCLIRAFGVNAKMLIVANIVVQCATVLMIARSARILFDDRVGVVASAMFFFSPVVAFYSFSLLSEHLYFLLVSISLWLCVVTIVERSATRGCFYFMAMCVVVWMVVWTRSEGVVLWPALTLPVFAGVVVARRIKLLLLFAVCAVIIFGAGAVIGRAHNADHQTFFCSSDSWWPRLHGSCVENDGRFGGGHQDVFRIASESCPGRNIKYQLGYCPRELVPIIQSEIRRRWQEMNAWTMVKFLLRKELWDFGGERISFVKTTKLREWLSLLINDVHVVVVALLSLAYFILIVYRKQAFPPLQWGPLLIVLGVAAVLMVAESLPRYGLIMELLFPIYASAILVRLYAVE